MAPRGWTWDATTGPAGLGDRPLLGTALADEAMQAAIEATGKREQRRRLLPTSLVVTLVVAMGLWAADSMRHALAAAVDGWRESDAAGRTRWRLPSTAASVRARQRAGARLPRVLFHAVAGPRATAETRGAFLGGVRLMALDGTMLGPAPRPVPQAATPIRVLGSSNLRSSSGTSLRGICVCSAAGRFTG